MDLFVALMKRHLSSNVAWNKTLNAGPLGFFFLVVLFDTIQGAESAPESIYNKLHFKINFFPFNSVYRISQNHLMAADENQFSLKFLIKNLSGKFACLFINVYSLLSFVLFCI